MPSPPAEKANGRTPAAIASLWPVSLTLRANALGDNVPGLRPGQQFRPLIRRRNRARDFSTPFCESSVLFRALGPAGWFIYLGLVAHRHERVSQAQLRAASEDQIADSQRGFRQPLAFLCTAKAVADFFAEVLEHGRLSQRY